MLAVADVNQLATVRATALDKDAAALDAKFSLAIGKTSTIGIGYSGVIGARNVDHGARATLTIGF
jgi:subtilase-type serine protease